MIRLTEEQEKIAWDAYFLVIKRKRNCSVIDHLPAYSFLTFLKEISFDDGVDRSEEDRKALSDYRLAHLVCSIVIPIAKLYFTGEDDRTDLPKSRKEWRQHRVNKLANFIEINTIRMLP